MLQLRTRRFLRVLLGLATLAALVYGMTQVLSVLRRDPHADRFRFYVLFKDVAGLRVGSRVVYRGMEVGEVGRLELDRQARRVRVLIQVDRQASFLVTTTSQVWVVKPRVGLDSRSVTGLDTLIKESYVRLHAVDGGHPLASGEEILGAEVPPSGIVALDLEDPEQGDLPARVLLPTNHGLSPGSPVHYRGIPTGRVRSLDLVDGGRAVLVGFTVRRVHRSTVHENSRFWIDRPQIRGSVMSGLSVEGLGRILQAALVYDTPATKGVGPAPDGHLFKGLAQPPSADLPWHPATVNARNLARDVRDRWPGAKPLSPWVKVRYRAVEEDTLQDDSIAVTGDGVLYARPGGELLVLTGRSACDGTWLHEGTWYDRLRIADEQIRVFFDDGRVLPAKRVWTHPERDLAVLHLQPPKQGVPLPPWTDYLSFAGRPPKAADPSRMAGAGPVVLVHAERAWGVGGQARAEPARTVVAAFALVPAAYRPGKR